MKTIIILIALTFPLAFTAADKLTGRWESKPSVNGNVTGVVFKENIAFEAYVNKKPFTSGSYTLQHNIFTFTDNGCQGMTGVYKILFFSNSDSLRFKAVSDSCTERKNGMEKLVLGRVK